MKNTKDKGNHYQQSYKSTNPLSTEAELINKTQQETFNKN